MVNHFFTKDDVCAAFNISSTGLDAWVKREFGMPWLAFKKKYFVYGKITISQHMFNLMKAGDAQTTRRLYEMHCFPEFKHKVQLSGDEDAPVVTKQKTDYDKLSIEQLEQLAEISKKLTSND